MLKRRRIVASIALTTAVSLGLVGTAIACADSSPVATWRLAAPSLEDVSRPMLAPGNDTRVNLVWLMRTIHPVGDGAAAYVKPDFATEELGHSFLTWSVLRASFWPRPDEQVAATQPPGCAPPAGAASGFDAAVTGDADVPASERVTLIALRAKVGCEPITVPATVHSSHGRLYLTYLMAAASFYAGDWQAARVGFAALTAAPDPWLAETAAYMPIRVALRQALVGAVDQYGDFAGADKADRAQVAEARTAIADYLHRWPRGRYAASARGLTRRVLWLTGDTGQLARVYERLLATTPAGSETAADLAEEIDLKLLAVDGIGQTLRQAGDTPLLLAIDDLRQMRGSGNSSPAEPLDLSAADLAAQAQDFTAHRDLFTFLEATRNYYAGAAGASITAFLPENAQAAGATPLAYSRQMLRRMALAKASDAGEVRFWSALIPRVRPLYQRPFAELGLALRWQRDDRLDLVFSAGSLVQDRMIREILLQTVAARPILRGDAADLTRTPHERDVARFTLLYKDLSRQAYADFGRDLTLVPAGASNEAPYDFAGDQPVPVGVFTHGKWSDGFTCPSLATTALKLTRNRNDPRALLCLGDFWRLNGFDGFSPQRAQGKPDTLGHGPDRFGGKPLTRNAIYAAIIADAHAPSDERAYALYRAVMCYAPSGYSSCIGPVVSGAELDAAEVPVSVRRNWFLQLKKRYPGSRWAHKLQYYW